MRDTAPSKRLRQPGYGRLVLLALAVLMVAPLAGCGKKSNLEVPPNSDFPRAYPSR